MSPKCPNCGYQPPRGRPKKVDDKRIKALLKAAKGKPISRRQMAKQLGITEGAIRAREKKLGLRK